MEPIGNVYPPDSYLLARCAPIGFGLGGSAKYTSNLDQAVACGWYSFNTESANNPFGCDGVMLVLNGNSTDFVQIAFAGGVVLRNGRGSRWDEWEYMNPPMIPGTEYRTAEKWNGNPVYTTLVSVGSVNESSVYSKTEFSAHHIVRHSGYAGGNSLPVMRDTFANSSLANVTIAEDGLIDITVYVGPDMIGKDVCVRVWYTKQ